MIVSKLNSVKVWTPGSDIDARDAFRFWGYVFQWEGKARGPEERRRRFRQVHNLLNNLYWDEEAEAALFDVYYWGSLNRTYKTENHPGHRFFQALQGHVWKFGSKNRKKTDRPWKWVRVPNNDNPLAPFKGLHW